MKGSRIVAVCVLGAVLLGGCAKPDASQPAMTAQSDGMKMTGDMGKDMAMMSSMMVERLGTSDANYEARFIDMMIPHHEAAVLMAKDALAKSNKAELKQLAQDIIAAQEKEIAQMKEWRLQWYGR